MELALTFGAIGDFISIASLIKDVLSALDDSHGSTKAYGGLIDEISHLQKALEQVEHIFRGPDLPSGLRNLISIAQSTIIQVHKALKEFHSRIYKKYGNSLTEGGSGNIFKDAAKKIQFKLEEKDVAKFRAEFAGYRMSIELFLQVTAVRLEQENHKAVMAKMGETARSTTAVVHRYGHSIESRLGFLGRRILSRLDFVAKLGIDMTKSASQILSMMIAVSGDLSVIRSVVMRLDRGVNNGDHFVLEDATGRSFPIHMKTITSWEAFNFILEDRFKGKKGERRTRRNLYSLHESASHLEIDRSAHFESAFLPYQKVDMSLICKAPENSMVDDGETGLSICPWCKAMSPGKLGDRVQCSTCRRDFLRVVIEVEDSEKPRISPSTPRSQHLGKRAREDDDDEACNECSKLKRCKKAQVEDRKRKRLQEYDSDSESDEENLAGLAHVTLQTKRMRLLQLDNVADEDSDQELKSADAALNEQLGVRSPVLDCVSSAKKSLPLDKERENSFNLPSLSTNGSRSSGGDPSHPAAARPQHREDLQGSQSIHFHHWQPQSSLSGGRGSSEAHLLTHEKKRQRRFPCMVADCNEKFILKADLQRHHQCVHMKKQRHKYNFCGRLFSREDNVKRHMEERCAMRFGTGMRDEVRSVSPRYTSNGEYATTRVGHPGSLAHNLSEDSELGSIETSEDGDTNKGISNHGVTSTVGEKGTTDGEGVQPLDRWAQIRKYAAERAAQTAAQREAAGARWYQNMMPKEVDEDTSGEESIETRVARIKARVAELIGKSQPTENTEDGQENPGR